jgi:nuclease (SNase domain protein)|nr:MAG TPA: nuclease-like protein [Caudoviricetes sp.]
MIEDGYGFEYTYNLPYKYQSEFKSAQKTASEKKFGLWADSACKGERKAIEDQKTDKKSEVNQDKKYHL